MIKQLFSISPLVLFIALLFFLGYSTWRSVNPARLTQVPTLTPTATKTPSPTVTASPPSTRTPTSSPTNTPAPRPTATSTSGLLSSPTATPMPTPTAKPSSVVWVQTNSKIGEVPRHTLGIILPDGQNPVLQPYGAAPALSPDGSKVAFFSESSSSGYDTGIWIAELAGGLLENYKKLADVTGVQNIAWSPDGDKLAYEVITNPNDPREAWLSQIRIARSNPDDDYIELDRFDGRQPAWSPDSQRLVYYSCKGGSCGLFRLNCAGGNCDEAAGEQITFDSTDSYPAWSSDGNLVFASNRSGNQEIYLWQPEGDPINLTNRPSIETTPVFSRDGQKIFFRTDYPNALAWQIQVITLNDDRRSVREISTLLDDVGGDDDWGMAQPAVR